MKSGFSSTLINLLTALPYPHYCPSCHEYWPDGIGYICSDCWGNMTEYPRSARSIGSEDKHSAIVAYSYTGITRDLVHQMKFTGRIDIAREFGKRGARIRRHRLMDCKFDLVVPVPLHPVRVRERGYDQNLEIARAVADELKVELRTDLIFRKRNTPPQSRLSDKQRLSNLQDAIVPVTGSVSSSKLKILVVDDVIHTGTTIMSCMRAFASCGQDDVIGMAICG